MDEHAQDATTPNSTSAAAAAAGNAATSADTAPNAKPSAPEVQGNATDAAGLDATDLDTLTEAARGGESNTPQIENADTSSRARRADGDDLRGPVGADEFELPEFSSSASAAYAAKRMTMLNDVNLRVKIELGRTRMLVEDVLKLGEGSVVELDKLAGDPVDVYVNERLVARGEVLVLNESFCVRISEVLSHDPHRVSA